MFSLLNKVTLLAASRVKVFAGLRLATLQDLQSTGIISAYLEICRKFTIPPGGKFFDRQEQIRSTELEKYLFRFFHKAAS